MTSFRYLHLYIKSKLNHNKNINFSDQLDFYKNFIINDNIYKILVIIVKKLKNIIFNVYTGAIFMIGSYEYLTGLLFDFIDFLYDIFLHTCTTILEFYIYFNENSNFLLFFFFFFYFFNVFFLSFITFFFGVRGVFFISTTSIFLFWLIQFYYLNFFLFDGGSLTLHFDLLNFFVGNTIFSFSLKLDFISYSFLFLTTSIGLCANVYSLNYFKNEPYTDRFILFLNWFILSMSLLVTSDNALLLFLGWELIGLTSFLLINFWTIRRNTLKSAIKAFTFNKVSDIFLLFFIIIITHNTGSLNLTDWYSYYMIKNNFKPEFFYIPALILIVASSIKSAQLIGHLWLPDSMEAPIPASALIHSATLVSAGIYLLLKFNWLLKSQFILVFILFLGSITALYGAIISAAQTDCKKLLAYSTISHCGFLFVTISMNNVYLTITYLYLHGFFKALTFFCVGNLVKISKGYQDTRKMGQLFIILPVESILLVICSINLAALPFTVGYFYKSLLQTVLVNLKLSIFLLPFIFVAMLTSIIYVFRLIFYSLFDIQKNNNLNFDYFFRYSYRNIKYSNTTFLGYIFIFLLLIVTTYVYYFYLLFLDNFIFFNICLDLNYLEFIQTLKKNNLNYLYLFYVFFIVVSMILIFYSCRVEFSYLKKNYFFYYIFLFFIFLSFIFYFFLLFV